MGFSLKLGTWERFVWLLFRLVFLSGAPPLTHALHHLGLTADTRINVIQHLVHEGEMLPTLYFPAVFGAWFALASLKEGESWRAFRGTCCACVCSVARRPRNNRPLPLESPAQCVPGAFVGEELSTWPCEHSAVFFFLNLHVQTGLVLSVWQGFRSPDSWKRRHSHPVDSRLCAQNSKERAEAFPWPTRVITSYQFWI